MAKRIKVNEGDIFEVILGKKMKGYLQFICLDMSQLNSEVIRVFSNRYHIDSEPDFVEILNSDIQFHTHVVVKDGVKEGIWNKIGNMELEEEFELPFFRSSGDYGNPKVKKSNDWYIWQVNGETIPVGNLDEEQKRYDLGPVLLPYLIKEMMITNKLSFFYPSY